MKMIWILVIALFASTGFLFGQSDMLIKRSDKGLYVDHKVQPKENFYSIGRFYNIPPKEMAAFNDLDMNVGLNKDQVIRIPLVAANFSQGINIGTPVYFRAGDKDDLKKVSAANKNVPLESLRRWNSMTTDKINPGSRLVVGFMTSKAMASTATKAETFSTKKDEPKQEIKTDPVIAKKDEPKQETKTEPATQRRMNRRRKLRPNQSLQRKMNRSRRLRPNKDPMLVARDISNLILNSRPNLILLRNQRP